MLPGYVLRVVFLSEPTIAAVLCASLAGVVECAWWLVYLLELAQQMVRRAINEVRGEEEGRCEDEQKQGDKNLRASSHLSSLALEASDSLLSPLSSHLERGVLWK